MKRFRQSPKQREFPNQKPQKGYVLPITLGLGLALVILGLTVALVTQTDRKVAQQRRESATSLAVTESAVDRILAQLSSRNNTILMGRNYDPINPQTGNTYLGADNKPNSGDETSTALDEWTGFNPSDQSCFQIVGVGAPNLALTGSIGTATYTILAYRYSPDEQVGTLLVEGDKGGQKSRVAITLKVEPDWQNFPSIVGTQNNSDVTTPVGAVALRGRQLLGNANVYFNPYASADPSLRSFADPGAADRTSYLNALWASPSQDGAGPTDPVPGRITACNLSPWPNLPAQPSGTMIIDSNITLTGNPGQTTYYWVDQINLNGTDTITVDTTQGRVEIILKEFPAGSGHPNFQKFVMLDHSKIVNVRTDNQPPRVGDLRIISMGDGPLSMHCFSCIQTAMLWMPYDELRLITDGPGCSGGRNTNFEGVVWAEAILSSKNHLTNRDIAYLGFNGLEYDTRVLPNITTGIYVPDDLSSLSDLIPNLNWPVRYRFQGILAWQQVR